jgi:hypothetical protein
MFGLFSSLGSGLSSAASGIGGLFGAMGTPAATAAAPAASAASAAPLVGGGMDLGAVATAAPAAAATAAPMADVAAQTSAGLAQAGLPSGYTPQTQMAGLTPAMGGERDLFQQARDWMNRPAAQQQQTNGQRLASSLQGALGAASRPGGDQAQRPAALPGLPPAPTPSVPLPGAGRSAAVQQLEQSLAQRIADMRRGAAIGRPSLTSRMGG